MNIKKLFDIKNLEPFNIEDDEIGPFEDLELKPLEVDLKPLAVELEPKPLLAHLEPMDDDIE